jgi:hypothetical protein
MKKTRAPIRMKTKMSRDEPSSAARGRASRGSGLALRTGSKSGRRLLALTMSCGVAVAPLAGCVTLAAGAALWLLPGTAAHAASVPVERVADGQVVSKTDAPVSGAIVFLKDGRSQTIRTYICDQQGHFHFGQLSQDTDYQLWAESNGVRSKSKDISSFDSRNEFNFTLKIDGTK